MPKSNYTPEMREQYRRFDNIVIETLVSEMVKENIHPLGELPLPKRMVEQANELFGAYMHDLRVQAKQDFPES